MNNVPIYKKVAAKQGSEWLTQAFQLFSRSKGVWFGIVAFIFFLLLMPVISNLMAILMPVALGGIMIGCKESSNGGSLKFDHLFSGIRKDAKELLIMSAIYAIGSLLVMLLTFVIMIQLGLDYREILPDNLDEMTTPQVVEWANQLDQAKVLPILLLGMLISLGLMIPLFMAFWFAPALVVFHKQRATHALMISFSACKENTVPFLVYGVVALGYILAFMFILSLLLMTLPIFAIPMMIAGYFAFFAISLASIYTAYIDIFDIQAESDADSKNDNPSQEDESSSMLA